MTRNPVFVSPDMSINDVRSLMQKEKIGHVPVLDKDKTLVGLITREDLFKASPSAATTLDMYEISYLLSKMTAREIMVKNVITATENDVVEEAARIMADKNIGCLPILREKLLVGIITDTDLFRVFVNAFGARHSGIRITFSLKEKQGQIARLTEAIAAKNGNLVSMVTSEGDDLSSRRVTIKVNGISRGDAEALIKGFSDFYLEDIRE